MTNLNTLKMIGLVILLAIALMLPTLLPKMDDAAMHTKTPTAQSQITAQEWT